MSPKHTRLWLRASVAAVLLAVVTHTRADPDLFGHVRFGHDIVAAGSVKLADAYSFASDRPWINHEWLAETAMYLAYAAAGAFGLVALKLALIAVLLTAATRSLRTTPLGAPARDLLLAILVICTFPQTNHIRPQLFSLALFAGLLDILERSRRAARWLAACIPLFAVWVNLHGGWIVGGAVLAAWSVARLFAAGTPGQRTFPLAVGVASLAATLCNPHGWRMWQFLYDTVGFGRADIVDWQPIFVAGRAYGLLWTLTAAAAAAGLWRSFASRDVDVRAAAIVLLLGIASFRVGRLLAFFTIATVMLLAPAVGAALSTLSRERRSMAAHSEDGRRAVPLAGAATAAAMLAIALVVSVGATTLSARNIGCIRMEPELFPEPEVAEVVAQHRVRGRMLTWFDWGEYAIWYFAPGVSVSFDGRRETVYSAAAIERQLGFYARPEDRQAVLDALHPAYVWMPSRLTVTARLISDGWVPLFAGPRSTLLAKSADATPSGRSGAAPAGTAGSVLGAGAPRCFPGP